MTIIRVFDNRHTVQFAVEAEGYGLLLRNILCTEYSEGKDLLLIY